MLDQRESRNDVREVRIEGLRLYVLGGLVVAALVGSFYLGRWIERSAGPVSGTAQGAIVTADEPGRELAPADVDATATHFDRVTGAEQEREPGRQARPATAPSTASAAVRPEAERGEAGEGGFYVQVMALHDRASAARLVEELKSKGFPVRMQTDRGSGSSIYKVRVGGYATRKEAEEMSARLRREGYEGAWVTP